MSKKIWTPEREREAIAHDKNLMIAEMCQRMGVSPPDLLVATVLAMAETNIPGTLKALRDLSQRLELMCAEVPDDPSKAN